MKNILSLEAGFMRNHSITGSGFYVGLNNMLLVQWWELERRIPVRFGPGKHKNAETTVTISITMICRPKQSQWCQRSYKIGKCNYTVPCRPTISATCSEDGTRTRSVMLELFLVAVPLSVEEESICCGRMMEGDDPEPLPASDNDRLLSGSRSAITAKFWISRDSLLPQFSVRTSAGISNSNRIFSSFSSGIS